MTDSEREALRNSFKPTKIKVLYIGESPPAGGTFFYTANSLLFFAMQESFEQIFPDCGIGKDFLKYFQNNNFFLEDLCTYPINRLNSLAREEARCQEVKNLAARLAEIKPPKVISVMKEINPYLENAISISGIQIESFTKLPFPRIEYKKQFIKENVLALRNI